MRWPEKSGLALHQVKNQFMFLNKKPIPGAHQLKWWSPKWSPTKWMWMRVNQLLKYLHWIFTAVLGTSWSLCKTAVHQHRRLLQSTSFGIYQHLERAGRNEALSLATKTLVAKTQITQPHPAGNPRHHQRPPQPVAGNLMPQYKWRNIWKSVLLDLLLWQNPRNHQHRYFARVVRTGDGIWCKTTCR